MIADRRLLIELTGSDERTLPHFPRMFAVAFDPDTETLFQT
jgi:hypothetical protein